MTARLKSPESLVVFTLLLITFLFVWRNPSWEKKVFTGDGRGYYAYLPALFLHHDLSFTESARAEKEAYNDPLLSQHYIQKEVDGHRYNKCFPGVAFLQIPFFLLACLSSFLVGLPLDGYNPIFLACFQLGTLFYATLGFWLTRKIFKLRGASHYNAIFLAILTLFATNLFIYASIKGSMQHIFSFFLLSAFCYLASATYRPQNQRWLLLTLLFALLLVTRPLNGLILITLPFWTGKDYKQLLKQGLSLTRKQPATILPATLVICSLPLMWWIQTGHFTLWTYGNEGFNFSQPAIGNTLFSFRRGLLLWSPVILIALVMGISIKTRNKTRYIWLYFAILTYVISSWWTWNYGGGFGHRIYAEHQFIWMVLLIPALEKLSGIIKKSLQIALVACLCLSLLQGYQFAKGIIAEDYMDSHLYFKTFGKITDDYIAYCGATLDQPPFGKVIGVNHWHIDTIVDASRSETIQIFNFELVYQHGNRIFIKKQYEKIQFEGDNFRNVFWQYEGFDQEGKPCYKDLKPLYFERTEANNEWLRLRFQQEIPVYEHPIKKVIISIYNPDRKKLKIKNIYLEIEEYQ